MRSNFGSASTHVGVTTQKFYLRTGTPYATITTAEQSAAIPEAGASTDSESPRSLPLSATIGTGAGTNEKVRARSLSNLDVYFGKWSSQPLAQATIAAGSWTVGVNITESSTVGTSGLLPVLYIWRPSTNAVVGYIYDSAVYPATPEIGNNNPNTKYGLVKTISGSAVSVKNGDVLVYEGWIGIDSGGRRSDFKFYFDGTAEPTVGSFEASTASYVQAPVALQMY